MQTVYTLIRRRILLEKTYFQKDKQLSLVKMAEHLRSVSISLNLKADPADTWRLYNVASTSMQRQRCCDVV